MGNGAAGRADGDVSEMNRALFAWFETNARDLAFRLTRDPYAVLVSEVMLQQTQALRVEPAWRAFMARFPTPEALASASPAAVIRAWGNLGYNGRAVRLQRAAQTIVARHRGAVPDQVLELEALSGVGPYTARAVAAIAFGHPVAALDTNVGRVVRRLNGLDSTTRGSDSTGPPDSHAGATGSSPLIRRPADELVDPARAADWTHAMMDIGATVCRPRDPKCGACPLAPYCRTARHGRADRAESPRTRRRPSTRSANTGSTRPFSGTRRWLRGRIVQCLRERPTGRWVRFEGPLGVHPPEAVSSALQQLAAEGLIERDRLGRARLPLARPRGRVESRA